MSSTRETVQQFLQSVGAHDVDAILDVFGDEVDWVVPGTPSLPWIGRPTTKSQVAEYFPTMWSHFNLDESEVMIEAIVAAGSDAVVIGRFGQQIAASGRRFATDVAMQPEGRGWQDREDAPVRGHVADCGGICLSLRLPHLRLATSCSSRGPNVARMTGHAWSARNTWELDR